MGKYIQVKLAKTDDLIKWASDPDTINQKDCAEELASRKQREVVTVQGHTGEEQRLANGRETLDSNPFDPRIEISADAQYIAGRIIKHLWIIFVLLPFILGLFWVLLRAIG